MVRYTACPDSTCPSSCPITYRCSSASSRFSRPGGDHDERLVRAERHRVRHRVLGDEELRHLRQVQDGGTVQQQLVQVRELLVGRPHRAGQEQQPQAPVAEQPGQAAQQHVEAGEFAHGYQRRPVSGMLVGTGADPGQADAGTIRHSGHASHARRVRSAAACQRSSGGHDRPGPGWAAARTPHGPRAAHGRCASLGRRRPGIRAWWHGQGRCGRRRTMMFEPDAEAMPAEQRAELQLQRLRGPGGPAAGRGRGAGASGSARAGVTSGADVSLADLPRLPMTEKKDLWAAYPFGMLGVPRSEVVAFHGSSGTGGRPTLVGYTRHDLQAMGPGCAPARWPPPGRRPGQPRAQRLRLRAVHRRAGLPPGRDRAGRGRGAGLRRDDAAAGHPDQ